MPKPIQRCMLLDDDEMDNFIHERILNKSGLVDEVLVFSFGGDALDHLKKKEHVIDLIIVDINMPKMNGFEFLALYEKLPPDCRAKQIVMMLSTSSNPLDRAKADQFPSVSGYATKPLTLSMFQEMVAKTNGVNHA